jgi:predicted  nucleic acid-binding Zn-ribbon protein
MISLLVLAVALAATGYSHWHLRSQLNEAENGFHAALLAENKILLDNVATSLQKAMEYDADTRRALNTELQALRTTQDADRNKESGFEIVWNAEMENLQHSLQVQQRSIEAFETALAELKKNVEDHHERLRTAQNAASNAIYRVNTLEQK